MKATRQLFKFMAQRIAATEGVVKITTPDNFSEFSDLRALQGGFSY
jgi:hypothetical protein